MFGTGASSITYSVPETAKYLLEIQKNLIAMKGTIKALARIDCRLCRFSYRKSTGPRAQPRWSIEPSWLL